MPKPGDWVYALEETDFLKVGADEAMTLHGKIEVILGTLAIVAGLAIANGASESLFQSQDQVRSLQVRFALRHDLG